MESSKIIFYLKNSLMILSSFVIISLSFTINPSVIDIINKRNTYEGLFNFVLYKKIGFKVEKKVELFLILYVVH